MGQFLEEEGLRQVRFKEASPYFTETARTTQPYTSSLKCKMKALGCYQV